MWVLQGESIWLMCKYLGHITWEPSGHVICNLVGPQKVGVGLHVARAKGTFLGHNLPEQTPLPWVSTFRGLGALLEGGLEGNQLSWGRGYFPSPGRVGGLDLSIATLGLLLIRMMNETPTV